MQIFKIIGDKAYKTQLSKNINVLDFLSKNKDFVKVEVDLPNSKYYKFENDSVVVDTEKEDIEKATNLRALYQNYLDSTDYLMLLDNPANLEINEIRQIQDFRAEIRKVKTDLKKVISYEEKLENISLVEVTDFIKKYV